MKVLFTCGGTAGHVNPALALAGLIKERKPESEILFVGARRGLEKQLVEEAGRMELPGRPLAYQTTANFLRCFGLESIEALPELPDT